MSMPRAVRHINESRILSSLFRNGGMSRASLARNLGLTRSTVGNLVNGFVRDGQLLEVVEAPEGDDHRAGRPGLKVDINPSHAHFIGADLAVDRITLVVLNLKAEVVTHRTERFARGEPEAEVIVPRLAALIDEVVATLPAGAASLRGVCVTVPGTIDRSGTIHRVPIFGWRNLPLAARLRELLAWDGPLAFENDANAFAFAEIYGARPRPISGALCLYMDVGIGGGLIADGRIVYGAHGFAGEVGYIHVRDAAQSRPGQMPGSLETCIGRDAVVARYRQNGGTGADFDEFLLAVAGGEPAASATLDDWAFLLGRGIATLTSVVDPGHIILGGPVARLFPHAEAAVLRSTRDHLLPDHPLPRIELSRLDAASAIGGACILHRAMMAIDGALVFNGFEEP